MRDFHGGGKTRKRLIVVRGCCVAGLALVMFIGCRSTDDFSRVINEPMPLSKEAREGFGTVGLLPDGWAAELAFPDAASLKHPAPLWAVKTFNRLEAATRIDGNLQGRQIADPRNYYDLGRILGIGVVAGGAALAEGIFSSVPQAQLDASRASISTALNEMPLEKGITVRIREVAASEKCKQLVAISESLLPIRGSQVLTNRDFHALTNAGIDTVLAIRINRQQFGVVRRLNPPTVFAVQLDVYLFRVRDGSVADFRSFDYESEERKFTEWGADDATFFRAELELAQLQLAQSVLTMLFDIDLAQSSQIGEPATSKHGL